MNPVEKLTTSVEPPMHYEGVNIVILGCLAGSAKLSSASQSQFPEYDRWIDGQPGIAKIKEPTQYQTVTPNRLQLLA